MIGCQTVYREERRRTPPEAETACAVGNRLRYESDAARDPSRIWVNHRIRLEDRENVWNVYHHNDLGNEPPQGSSVDYREEDEKGLRPRFPRHASSCGDRRRQHLRLLRAYVDDGLSHNLYLYRGDCVGTRGRGAFSPCLYLVPCRDPCETCHANGCVCHACHGYYDSTFSCHHILVHDVCHDGLFLSRATDETCGLASYQKNGPWSER
jgi:hypothetical protein